MPQISDAQIAAYARQAGVSGGNVAIAVAIALAESSGNTTAHNRIPPDDSYGLWQINMLGSLGPARRQQFGLSANSDLFNPATNARAMAAISSGGTNWKPWTTYTRGTYRVFLPRGGAASGTSEDPSVTNLGLPGAGSVTALVKFLELISQPGTWMRVGLGIGGVFMAAFGILRLGGISPEGVTKAAKLVIGAKSKVASVASKAVPK